MYFLGAIYSAIRITEEVHTKVVGYCPISFELEVVLRDQDVYDFLAIDRINFKVIHVHGDILVHCMVFIEAHPYIRFSLSWRESHFT